MPGTYRGHAELRAWAEAALEVSSEWQLTPEEFIDARSQALFVRVRVAEAEPRNALEGDADLRVTIRL